MTWLTVARLSVVRRADGVEEEFVDALVGGEFGVERGREQVALTDERGGAVALCERFHAGAGLGDAGRADVDHFERAAGQGGFGFEDAGVVLAAVGVAFYRDVKRAEGLLLGVGDVFGDEDDASAGAEGGFRLDEFLERVEEAAAFERLEEGGGFAAGDD